MSEDLWRTASWLVGRWRLLSSIVRDRGGTVHYPMGAEPEGSLVYTPAGWVACQIAAAERLPIATEALFSGPESERAQAYSTYVAYCGTYRVDAIDKTITHHITMSLFPNWRGVEHHRQYELTGDQLTLTAPPIKAGNDLLVAELRWSRTEPRQP